MPQSVAHVRGSETSLAAGRRAEKTSNENCQKLFELLSEGPKTGKELKEILAPLPEWVKLAKHETCYARQSDLKDARCVREATAKRRGARELQVVPGATLERYRFWREHKNLTLKSILGRLSTARDLASIASYQAARCDWQDTVKKELAISRQWAAAKLLWDLEEQLYGADRGEDARQGWLVNHPLLGQVAVFYELGLSESVLGPSIEG